MRRFKALLITIFATALLSGCGYHMARVANLNNHTTEVELSRRNFVVVEKVIGKADATYIFGIGGLSDEALIANAKANMLSNAELVGTARAIINETTEEHYAMIFPVYFKKTVTVSAFIVEFTD
ncbi:DUF6567 family protein [Nafulsella turpanensis]|uniref:DUF6567 family protein n=1 Tax=Nafulsella turpanensis TaxID=1265690 RepID=UPI0003787B97|nr:DUF6567 family protein [Nafulsella turpanensis]